MTVTDTITLENEKFEDNQSFQKWLESNKQKKYIIENCQFKDLKFDNSDINIKFINCSIDSFILNNVQTFSFKGGVINNFSIKGTINSNFYINEEDNDINQTKIKKLEIINSTFKEDFAIYKSKIDVLNLKNINFNSLSEFNEVIFQNEFDFKEITYEGFTLFDKCVFNTKAQFEYIIFEKMTSFRNSKFNRGLNLDYTNSTKDGGINFYGVKNLDSKTSKENTSQETYRIIKNEFEKLNNKIEANKYHALEMELHRKAIWSKEYITFKLLSDGIVSFIHWLSSNHSSNWFLALFWIFVVSFITTYNLECKITIDNIFRYINVLSNIEDFKDSYMAMTLNKVSLGYLYYQFLTAVRKDTRK